METRFIPENDFKEFIWSKGIGQKAKVVVVNGFNGWQITEDDGTQYIADVIPNPKPWYYKYQLMYWKAFGYVWTKYNAYKYSK